MNFRKLIFLFILLPAFGFAQLNIGLDTINRVDINKNKTGVWLEETGTGMRIGKYENGKREGAWDTYTAYGAFLFSDKYIAGKKQKTKLIRARFGDPHDKMKLEVQDSITLTMLFNDQKESHQKLSEIKPVAGVTTILFDIRNGKAKKIASFDSGKQTEQKLTFCKDSYTLAVFQKTGCIPQKLLIDFSNISGFPSFIMPWEKQIPVHMNDRIGTETYSLSAILSKPYEKIRLTGLNLISKEPRYSVYMDYILKNVPVHVKDSLSRIVENQNNISLINAQNSLENKEKQITQLEADNLTKQNELLKNEMQAQAKQKEIELLNKDKALQQLSILQNRQLLKQKELEAYKNQQALEIANQSEKLKQEELDRKSLELGHQQELQKQQAKELSLEKNLKTSLEKEARQQQLIKWIFIGIALLFVIFGISSYNRFRISRKQNKIIEAKNKETEFQKAIIEEKQKEILDSMRYAKRIQRSQMPTEKYIDRNLNRLNKKL
ncbi:MAG: hypothetical protein ACJ77K_09770 [Bacteroidia bacterium]